MVNNNVGAKTTIFSLEYGNTNGFHTTQIGPGSTLTVSNTTADDLVFVGTGTDNGTSQISYSTITGAGTFNVANFNSGSVFVVQQGSANNGSHRATLDLSGLANFNLTVGRLVVGGANPGSVGASNWLAGTLYLAATNQIIVDGVAPAVDVGDCINNGATSFLYLGQNSTIFADSFTIAHAKATSTMAFNPALVGGGPMLYLGGNTSARVSTFSVADFSSQSTSGSTTVGTVNLVGGVAEMLVDAAFVGRGQAGSGSGPSTGTLSLGAGEFDVNTLNVGYASSSTAVGTVIGTVNVTNGTLAVNNDLLLGYNAGSTAPTSGTLNITNGTVLASAVTMGGGTGRINVNGGFLAVSNTLGTLTAPVTSLSLNNGAELEFWITNNVTNAAVGSITGDSSGVIGIGALPIVLNYPSQYPLLYCPAAQSGIRFTAGTLPGIYRGYISNDNTSVVWLVITNGPALPKTDQWAGTVNHNWDTNTLNWTNNGLAAAYSEGDFALFNDAAQTRCGEFDGNHAAYAVQLDGYEQCTEL